jgi:2-dehydropantoate 2-reductase
MPKTTKPLSIAIIGAGQIGSAFGYQLARAGHNLTMIARPGSPRLNQLQQAKAIVLQNGERVPVRVADSLDEDASFDLVIVTTKAFQVDAFLPALARSKAASFHFLFANFNPDHIRDALPGRRPAFGMPFIQSWIDEAGAIKININKRQKTLHSDQRWVELFESAGLPSAFEADMMGWLRWHAPMTVAIEMVCVAGERHNSGATWREARTMARGIRAGFAILRGIGYEMHRSAKGLAGMPLFIVTLLLWWMSKMKKFRVLLASGEDEARSQADEIIVAARRDPSLASASKTVAAMTIR